MKEAILKRLHIIVFISMTFWKRQNNIERKQTSGCQGLGVGGEIDLKVPRGMFWADGKSLYLDCGGGLMIIYICQNSQNCILRMASVAICKLYLSEKRKTQNTLRQLQHVEFIRILMNELQKNIYEFMGQLGI